MKYIKNPPTLDELKSLYHSEVYQSLIKELEDDNIKLIQEEGDIKLVNMMLSLSQKRAIHLNILFEELESDFYKNTEQLLKYTKGRIAFFDKINDEDIDGKVRQGEELGEENKSKVVKY